MKPRPGVPAIENRAKVYTTILIAFVFTLKLKQYQPVAVCCLQQVLAALYVLGRASVMDDVAMLSDMRET